MKKLITVMFLLSMLASPVLAGEHYRGNDHHDHFRHHHDGIDPGAAAIIGLGGLMLGAVINEQSHRYDPPPVYYYPPSRPIYVEPRCVIYETRDRFGYLLYSRTVCRYHE